MTTFLGADTEAIVSSRRLIASRVQVCQQSCENLKDSVSILVWEGADADIFFERFRELVRHIEELSRRIGEKLDQLDREREAQEKASSIADEERCGEGDDAIRREDSAHSPTGEDPFPLGADDILRDLSSSQSAYTGWQLREDSYDRGRQFVQALASMAGRPGPILLSVPDFLPDTVAGVWGEQVDQLYSMTGSDAQFLDDLASSVEQRDLRYAGRAVEDQLLRRLSDGQPAFAPGAAAAVMANKTVPRTLRWLSDASKSLLPADLHAYLEGVAQASEDLADGPTRAQLASNLRRDLISLPWDDLPVHSA